MAIPVVPDLPAPPILGTDFDEDFSRKTDALYMAYGPWIAALNAAFQQQAALTTGYYNATSTTSVSISAGSKTFTIATGKAFAVGQPVSMVSAASPTTHRMFGLVTAHNATTGALTVNVTDPFGSGSRADWIIALSGEKGATGNPQDAGVDVQDFTSSGTWNRPANAVTVMIECWGGGGGGGSGVMDSSGGNANGGSGGGGGAYSMRLYKASELSASETVTVGAGGAGGAGKVNGTGNVGTTGGASSVGATMRCWAGGGAGGSGTASSNAIAGALGGGSIYQASIVGKPTFAPGSGEFDGHFGSGFMVGSNSDRHGAASEFGGGQGGGSYINGATVASITYGGSSSRGGAGGGGGGSANNTSTVATTGGAGGSNGLGLFDGAGGAGATGTGGSNGASATIPRTGGGGGGGSSVGSGASAGSGGAGAVPGGGGGGGGGKSSPVGGSSSGAGGNGAAGMVRITTWFDA